MVEITGMLRGGWFPEQWDVPVGMAAGVVITGYIGDAVAGFVRQWVPAEWLNPVSELIIGVGMFVLGGVIGADFGKWIRLFSFGALAVGIADAISVALGLVPTARAAVVRAPAAARYAITTTTRSPSVTAATLAARSPAKPDGARYTPTAS